MLPLQSPLEAYRTDLGRYPDRADFGRSDTVWLLVAHCVHRLTRVAPEMRPALAETCSAALRDLAGSTDLDADTAEHLTANLALLQRGLRNLPDREGADYVARALRAIVVSMIDAGAMTLAYSLLGHVRLAIDYMSPREHGLVFAEQGRVARLLGDLEQAEELYDQAAQIGDRTGILELTSRAALGKGVLARIRGNYPRAKLLFQKGLALAGEGGHRDLTAFAHQGLLIAATVAGDADTALVHGWAAYTHVYGDSTLQAEMLINLSHVALSAGYPSAAQHGFLSALTMTESLRVQLPALGGMATSAAHQSNAALLGRVASAVEQLLVRATFPYEKAHVLKSLSAAFAELGDGEASEMYRLRARELAEVGGFFELMHATEFPARPKHSPSAPRELARRSYQVIETLQQMEADASALGLATTRSD